MTAPTAMTTMSKSNFFTDEPLLQRPDAERLPGSREGYADVVCVMAITAGRDQS